MGSPIEPDISETWAFLQMSRKNTNSKADRKAGVTPLPNPPKFSTERRQGQKLQIAPPRSHTRRYNFSLQLFLEEANLPRRPLHTGLSHEHLRKREKHLSYAVTNGEKHNSPSLKCPLFSLFTKKGGLRE